MKIPQRQDQVSLGAPRTQSGRAVQPISGSLGDSYTRTMELMSKNFQELSDLQFKLSENAIQGQLNAFNVYVDSRTKQYNKDLSLATTQEQVKDLYDNYLKDVRETGNVTLGDNLYQDWERVKGGTTIAQSQYAKDFTNAKLQQQQNVELMKSSLNELNIMAGNALTPEEEQQQRNNAYELLSMYVSNGTITEGDSEKLRRQFDYNLDATKIERDIEADPEAAIKKLHTNEYAPAVTYPEREKFLDAAEKELARNEGTIGAKVENVAISIWQPLYDSDDKALRGEAYRIKDFNLTQLKQWMSKVSGISFDKIKNNDVKNFRSYMDTVINYPDQERNMAFLESYKAVQQDSNSLFFDSKTKKTTPVADRADTYNKNKPNLTQAEQLVDIYNQYKGFLANTESRTRLVTSDKFQESEDEKNSIADIFVNDNENKYLEGGAWYTNMQEVIGAVSKRLEGEGGTYKDYTTQKRLFVRALLDNPNQNIYTLFDGKTDYRVAVMQAYAKMKGVSLSELGEEGFRIANSLFLPATPELWSEELAGETKKTSQIKKSIAQTKYNIKSWANKLISSPERFK